MAYDEEREKDTGRVDPNEDNDPDKIEAGPNKYSFELRGYWMGLIDEHERLKRSYHDVAAEVVKRYRDVRNRASQEGQRHMNMLWANTRIMKPALYSKMPIPIVDRKFLDRDETGKLSAQIAERGARNLLKINNFHRSVNRAVLDKLLSGTGVVWVRYESEIGDSKSIPTAERSAMDDDLDKVKEKHEGVDSRESDSKTKELEDTGDQVLSENAPVDYLDWRDFYMFPVNARTWEEVQCVGKRIMMSKSEAKRFFGEEIGEAMQYDTTTVETKDTHTPSGMLYDVNDRTITTYELWNKADRRVYWVSRGYEYLCKVKDDFLQLERFFPCPEPLWGTITNDSVTPVPDFIEWQDQATQIDELTQRIHLLTRACKVAGTYDAANPALARLLTESVENQLFPVENWLLHGEKGGVPGAISFLPIKEIKEVIETLIMVRRQAMEDLDVVTGITDIMRGTTDSRETLGGLRLKNNNTGTRLSEMQEDVAQFCRGVVEICVEIMCKHFSDETLVEMSGIMYEEELNYDTVIAELQDHARNMQSGQGQQQPGQAPTQQTAPGAPPQAGAAQAPMGGNPQQMPPQPAVSGGGAGGGSPQPQGMPQAPQGQQQMQGQQQVPLGAVLQSQQHDYYMEMLEIAHKSVKRRVENAIDLLRKDIPRRYRIDIETDSTIFADAAQERENAVQFTTTFMEFMAAAQKVVQTLPEAMPLLGRMLQFGVRKFRVARDLEFAVDDFVDKMIKKAAQIEQNGPPPDPKVQIEKMKAQNEIQLQQAEAAREDKVKQLEMAHTRETNQLEMQVEKQKAGIEMQKEQGKLQMERERMGMEHQNMAMEQQHAQQMHTMDMQAAQQKGQLDIQSHINKIREVNTQHAQTMEQGAASHKQSMEQGAASHKQSLEQGKMKQDAVKASTMAAEKKAKMSVKR